ncbi:MAG TPA: protein translocase subunit SecD [Coxiellaceae bacterium]|nr:protein translocase subunit SecD [Coxiellaceae bacterium]
MNRYPAWRYVLLGALIILALLYALPNIYGEDPAVQVSARDAGSLKNVADRITQTLTAQQIPYGSIREEGNSILVRFADTTTQLKAQDFLKAALGSDYVIAANLAPKTPQWLQALGAEPMKLGLDLRGGIHFLLSVDMDTMIKEQEAADVRAMAEFLRSHQIRYISLTPTSPGSIQIRFSTDTGLNQAEGQLSQTFPDYQFKTFSNGWLLQGVLTKPALIKLQNTAIEQNMQILRNRVNALGVAEAIVARQGATHISVDLPGIQDTARAKELIGKVATIRMQLVDTQHDPEAAERGVVPFGSQLYSFDERPILLKEAVILQGSSIGNAATILDENGRPAVSIRLNGQGVNQFNRITGENIGKPMAVIYVETKTDSKVVNGKIQTTEHPVERIISVATIQSALGNNFQITGLQSVDYAKNLALLLRSGAYTAPVTFVEERLVGPSLGAANIHKGILSTEIGSLLVIVFMALYYRVFGLIADMALILNIVFIVAVLSLLGATLTLPGIAGIVLTVGMAVDANVLINERIREELRNGTGIQASIHAGYERAFATIVDANVTTLIVAVVLFSLGSGSVQGFAVTLTIGLLMSMVTAIFFTRAVVNLVYGRRSIRKLSIGI